MPRHDAKLVPFLTFALGPPAYPAKDTQRRHQVLASFSTMCFKTASFASAAFVYRLASASMKSAGLLVQPLAQPVPRIPHRSSKQDGQHPRGNRERGAHRSDAHPRQPAHRRQAPRPLPQLPRSSSCPPLALLPRPADHGSTQPRPLSRTGGPPIHGLSPSLTSGQNRHWRRRTVRRPRHLPAVSQRQERRPKPDGGPLGP